MQSHTTVLGFIMDRALDNNNILPPFGKFEHLDNWTLDIMCTAITTYVYNYR